MISFSVKNDFIDWRVKARKMLVARVAPNEILWTNGEQTSLFASACDVEFSLDEQANTVHKVSADFISLAEAVACYDDEEKWSLLYRLLFRLVYENKNLLHIDSDTDVRQARMMQKAVSRDVHKFHAFVRFRSLKTDEQEIFAAWHVPAHYTVERAVPFFVRRFGAMNFSILTPKGCAHWDTETLTFSAPVGRADAPEADETEEFWLSYYKSIFNPFRLKIKAMKAELPVRHWQTLPEARLIPELIRRSKELESRVRFKKF